MRFLVAIFGALLSSVFAVKRPQALLLHHKKLYSEDAKFDSSMVSMRRRRGSSDQTTENILLPRGGSDPYGSYGAQPEEYAEPYQQQEPYYNTNEEESYYYDENYQQQRPQNDADYYYNENDAPMTDPFQETVQDRVDRWKAAQTIEHQDLGPRDAQGRIKLLTSIGQSSRAFIFAIFIFRDLYFYERTNNLSNAVIRFVSMSTVLSMLLLNCAGVVAAISSASHSSKKRLKAILNVDKVVEIIVAVNCFLRLLFPGKVPRELLIGSIFHSAFFLINAQAITKFSWDETEGVPIRSYQTQTQQQQPY